MVDRPFWTALLGGHIQRVEHEFGPKVVGHGPADNTSAEGIQHDCQGQIPRIGRHVGDVCYPQLIGLLSSKIAFHKVWSRPTRILCDRRRRSFSVAYAA